VFGLWSTTQCPPTAKINRVKDLALIFWRMSVYPNKMKIFCQKHLEQAFFYVVFHSRPFNEMFIVNGKSHCCNDTFAGVEVDIFVVYTWKFLYKSIGQEFWKSVHIWQNYYQTSRGLFFIGAPCISLLLVLSNADQYWRCCAYTSVVHVTVVACKLHRVLVLCLVSWTRRRFAGTY